MRNRTTERFYHSSVRSWQPVQSPQTFVSGTSHAPLFVCHELASAQPVYLLAEQSSIHLPCWLARSYVASFQSQERLPHQISGCICGRTHVILAHSLSTATCTLSPNLKRRVTCLPGYAGPSGDRKPLHALLFFVYSFWLSSFSNQILQEGRMFQSRLRCRQHQCRSTVLTGFARIWLIKFNFH